MATSQGIEIASPPNREISSTNDINPDSLRAHTTIFAPRWAKWRAVSRPIPLEAPTIATTC